jgi:hypothetical protein
MKARVYEMVPIMYYFRIPSGMDKKILFIQNGVLDEKIVFSPWESENEKM